MDTLDLGTECFSNGDRRVMAAIVQVESGGHPYSIGVVNGALQRQPRSKAEAVATARAQADAGWNFSLGPSQVNRYNLARMDLDYETAFDPCANLRAGSRIFGECHDRARARFPAPPQALAAALSCYYSGNFRRGLVPDEKGKPSYVAKVLAALTAVPHALGAVPEALPIPVRTTSGRKPSPQRAPLSPAANATPTTEEGAIASARNGRQAERFELADPFDGYAASHEQARTIDGYAGQQSPQSLPRHAENRRE